MLLLAAGVPLAALGFFLFLAAFRREPNPKGLVGVVEARQARTDAMLLGVLLAAGGSGLAVLGARCPRP